MAPTSTAVFRAVADFASLNREVRRTRKEIQQLQADSGKTGGWDKFDASLKKVSASQEKLRKETDALSASQGKLGKGTSGLSSLEKALTSLATAQTNSAASGRALAAAHEKQVGVAGQLRAEMTELGKSVRSVTSAEDAAIKRAQDHAKALGDERNAASSKTNVLNQLTTALDKNSSSDRDAADAADKHAGALDREAGAATRAQGAMDPLGTAVGGAGRAANIAAGDHDLFRESIDRLTTSASSSSSSLSAHSSSVQSAGSAAQSAVGGNNALAGAIGASSSAANSSTSAHRGHAGAVSQSSAASRAATTSSNALGGSLRGVGTGARQGAAGAGLLGATMNPLKSGMRAAGEAGQGLKLILIGLAVPTVVAGIQLLGGALSALVGGLTAVVAAAGPAVGALAALGPAAIAGAGAIGTIMLSFRGVGDALKALGKVEEETASGSSAAAKQRVANAKAIGAAQRGVRDAIQGQQDAERAGARSVADAQRALDRAREDAADTAVRAARRISDANDDLVRANERVIRAEADLSEARRQAIRDLEDLNERIGDNALSLEGAEIRLLRALERQQETNADATASMLDRREASLAVAEAQDNLSDVQRQSTRDTSDLNDAQRAGVNGMAGVVSAQDGLSSALDSQQQAARDLSDAQAEAAKAQRDAAQSIGDAERNLSEAREDSARRQRDAAERVGDAMLRLAEAQAAAAESTGEMSAASRDLASAFEKLSPKGRELVELLFSLRGKINEISQAGQEAMFPGLISALKILAPMIDTVVIPSVEAFGTVIGSVGERFATEVKSWEDDLISFGTGEGPEFVDKFGTILINLLGAMENVGMAATPLLLWLTDLGVKLAEYWDEESRAGRNNGSLALYFDGVRTALELLGTMLYNFGGIISEVFDSARPYGQRMLEDFNKLTEKTREWMATPEGKDRLNEYFDKTSENAEKVLGLLGDMGIAFLKMGESPALGAMLDSIEVTLKPSLTRFFEELGESMEENGPLIIELLAGILDIFTKLMEGDTGGFAAFISVIKAFVDTLGFLLSIPGFADLAGILLAIAGGLLAIKAVGKLTGLNRVAGALNRMAGGAGRAAGAGAGAGAAAAGGAGAGGAAGGTPPVVPPRTAAAAFAPRPAGGAGAGGAGAGAAGGGAVTPAVAPRSPSGSRPRLGQPPTPRPAPAPGPARAPAATAASGFIAGARGSQTPATTGTGRLGQAAGALARRGTQVAAATGPGRAVAAGAQAVRSAPARVAAPFRGGSLAPPRPNLPPIGAPVQGPVRPPTGPVLGPNRPAPAASPGVRAAGTGGGRVPGAGNYRITPARTTSPVPSASPGVRAAGTGGGRVPGAGNYRVGGQPPAAAAPAPRPAAAGPAPFPRPALAPSAPVRAATPPAAPRPPTTSPPGRVNLNHPSRAPQTLPTPGAAPKPPKIRLQAGQSVNLNTGRVSGPGAPAAPPAAAPRPPTQPPAAPQARGPVPFGFGGAGRPAPAPPAQPRSPVQPPAGGGQRVGGSSPFAGGGPATGPGFRTPPVINNLAGPPARAPEIGASGGGSRVTPGAGADPNGARPLFDSEDKNRRTQPIGFGNTPPKPVQAPPTIPPRPVTTPPTVPPKPVTAPPTVPPRAAPAVAPVRAATPAAQAAPVRPAPAAPAPVRAATPAAQAAPVRPAPAPFGPAQRIGGAAPVPAPQPRPTTPPPTPAPRPAPAPAPAPAPRAPAPGAITPPRPVIAPPTTPPRPAVAPPTTPPRPAVAPPTTPPRPAPAAAPPARGPGVAPAAGARPPVPVPAPVPAAPGRVATAAASVGRGAAATGGLLAGVGGSVAGGMGGAALGQQLGGDTGAMVGGIAGSIAGGMAPDMLMQQMQKLGPVVDNIKGRISSMASTLSTSMGSAVTKVKDVGAAVGNAAKHYANLGIAALKSGAQQAASFVAAKAAALGGLIADLGRAAGAYIKLGIQAALSAGRQVAAAAAAGIVRAGLAAWAAAQWLLNAAMNANPIGLIVLAIVALVAALIWAWNNSETFRNIVIGMWEGIKSAFEAAIGFIMPIWNVFWDGLKNSAIAVWNAISAFFSGAFSVFSAIFSAIWNGISAVWGAIWSGIKSVAEAVWNGISSFFTAVWAVFQAAWNVVLALFSGSWSDVWNAIKALGEAIWNAIKAYFEAAWNVWKAIFEAVMNVLKAGWNAFWEGLKAVGIAIWNAIKAFFDAAFNAFRVIFESIINTIKAIWDGFWNVLKTVATAAWNIIKDGIGGALEGIKNAFKSAVDWIGDMWRRIMGIVAEPVNFVIREIYNNGIRAMWGKVAGWLGLPELPVVNEVRWGQASGGPVPITDDKRRGGHDRRSGGKISGSVHGRDSVPILAQPGEYMLSARAVRNMGGVGAVDTVHSQAKRGLMHANDRARYATGGPVTRVGMAGGGAIWSDLIRMVQAGVPGTRLTSAVRRGDPGYHGRGQAVDLAGRTSMDMPHMLRVNKWIAQNHGANAAELIHTQPGAINLLDGRSHRYKPATVNDHRDHVHWAVDSLNGNMGGAGGEDVGFWENPILNQIRAIVDGATGLLKGGINGAIDFLMPGNGIMKDAAKAMPNKMIDDVGNWIKSKANELFGYDSGTGREGAGSPELRQLVQGIAAKYGWGSPPEWAALDRLIYKESSWDPTAQNPTSTAFGLFQFLNGTWAQTGIRKTGNPGLQAEAGMKYIRSRYGSPTKALDFHNRNNWYAQGGRVGGSGTGDTQPAMLTPGEFVIRKPAVDAIGVQNLERMNAVRSVGSTNADAVQRMALGGVVERNGGPAYQIRRGDTLSGIARAYGTTVAELQRMNSIANANKIYAGAWLNMPRKATPAGGAQPANPAAEVGRHMIQRGDTLSALALRFKTTVAELQRLNNIKDPNKIYAGAWMSYPKAGAINPAPVPAPTPPAVVPPPTVLDLFAEGIAANTKDTKEFEGNLLTLTRWGHTELALALAKMGMKSGSGDEGGGGLALSREAIKSPDAAARVNAIIKDSQTVLGESLESMLSIMGSLQKTAGQGLREVSTDTKIDTKAIFEVMGKAQALSEVAKLPAANKDKFLSNIDSYKRGLPFAAGGRVGGTGNRDTVPAMLTPGEFVLRRAAVKKIGMPSLQRMNQADKLPTQKFATGGPVMNAADLFSLAPAPNIARPSVGRAVQEKLASAVSRSAETTNSKSVVFSEGAVKVVNPAPRRATDSFESVMQKLTWSGVFS